MVPRTGSDANPDLASHEAVFNAHANFQRTGEVPEPSKPTTSRVARSSSYDALKMSAPTSAAVPQSLPSPTEPQPAQAQADPSAQSEEVRKHILEQRARRTAGLSSQA